MKTEHTLESLAALKRNQLVALAVKNGIEKPHSTTTSKMIVALMAKFETESAQSGHASSEAVSYEGSQMAASEGGASTAVIEEPITGAQVNGGDTANMVPFPAQEPEQTDIPVEKEAPKSIVSNGIFKINRKTFLMQLAAISKVTGGSKTVPMLARALITFGGGRLKVEGTNLDVALETEVPAETSGEHSFAVPFAVLKEFVAKCSSEFLMAESKGGRIYLSDIENRTDIMTFGADEWPPAPLVGTVELFEISSNRLIGVINETIAFASEDETRYTLNGLYLNGKCTLVVATDGRRLVTSELRAEKIASIELEPEGSIIPIFAAEVIRSSIPRGTNAKVARTSTGSRLSITAELNGLKYKLVTKLVEGNYPNYQQVIPKETRDEFVIDREQLLSAMGRLIVMTSDRSKSVKLTFTKNSILFNVASPDTGSGKEEIAVTGEPKEGEPIVVSLAPEYLRDLANSWTDEKVTLSVKDEVAPIVGLGAGKLAVIMPMRQS